MASRTAKYAGRMRRALVIKIPDRIERARIVDCAHQISAQHEEDIDAEESRGKKGGKQMKKENEQDRSAPDDLDVGAESGCSRTDGLARPRSIGDKHRLQPV